MVGNNEMRSNIDIKIGNTKLEQVKQFYYLGSTKAFQKKKNVLMNKYISIEVRKVFAITLI